MSCFQESSLGNFYQFPCWSASATRSHTSSLNKNTNHAFKLRIDSRNQFECSSNRRFAEQNAQLFKESRVLSPPPLYQPSPTPDLCSMVDQPSLVSSHYLSHHLKSVRVKSAAIGVPIKMHSDEILMKNFPKHTHERRKVFRERMRQKQKLYKFDQENLDGWFQLRESLEELKHLATSDEILANPTSTTFNYDALSAHSLKQSVYNHHKNRAKTIKIKNDSEKAKSAPKHAMSPTPRPPARISTAKDTLPLSRRTKQSIEACSQSTLEPLTVSAKPIHCHILPMSCYKLKLKPQNMKPPSTAPARVRSVSPSTLISSILERHVHVSIPDATISEDALLSSTGSPALEDLKQEEDEKLTETDSKIDPSTLQALDSSEVLSNVSLKSKIKLKHQFSRCRSATDTKHLYSSNKNYPRFILITDDEHRIESWYHRYPFIVSSDLLESLQSKPAQTTTAAYFIDDSQKMANSTATTKIILQGKPFNVNSGWIQYDVILISKAIYHQIIIHLQTIINLIIKSSGKVIHIYQISHNEDLKTQVGYICKQLKQQVFSHA